MFVVGWIVGLSKKWKMDLFGCIYGIYSIYVQINVFTSILQKKEYLSKDQAICLCSNIFEYLYFINTLSKAEP